METARDLTTTEFAVLGLLGFGEASGYDLARSAARSIGYMWAPSRSQIYKVLPRLVSFGYATSREVAQRTRPDKALYRITDEGRAALEAWVSAVEDEPQGGSAVFLLKLFFGWAAAPEATLRQLDAYRALLERRLGEFQEIERNLAPDEPVHSLIALRHGSARATATLAWAAETRAALEEQLASSRSRS
jgi:PadR family transcriptional regulator, regulatory protein AphA